MPGSLNRSTGTFTPPARTLATPSLRGTRALVTEPPAVPTSPVIESYCCNCAWAIAMRALAACRFGLFS